MVTVADKTDNSPTITSISLILPTIKEQTLKISTGSSVPNFSYNSKDKRSRALISNRPLISTRCSRTTPSSACKILASSMRPNSVKTTNRISDRVRDLQHILIKVMGRIWTLWTSRIWYNKEWLKQNPWRRTNNSADQQIKISSETYPNKKSARNIAKRETMAA